ncbi:hypothetical protein K438DRAFT_1769293 [Mycena galopus ATCC 62051]|nr:hypothetical protein K438DRAFT_1769293 [Mycena galopus ATCC 62051]
MFQIQEKHVKQDLLVRAFHGHAHNRWCQLKYLATYVERMGIENLEGCLFGTFLVNNYKQAVVIPNTGKTVKHAMAQAGVTEEMMEAHLEEEKVYLDGLSVEPEEETDHMEYYQQLVNLTDGREKLKDVFAEGSNANRTTRQHAKENYDRAVETVQTTECRLSIEARWTTEDPEWIQAAELVTMQRYQPGGQADLELTKVNQSAYKLRDHIAKALKARSKAIRNTLNRYNTAGGALDPPGRLLTLAEVVHYTFLSNFDILRNPDTTSICAWAPPAAHQLLDTYYKLEQAREEIQRPNIEIRRFVTHMKNERTFLVRFDNVHSKRLQAMKDKLGPAFTGTLQPGIRVSPPVPLVRNPEEQGTVPSEPPMPPMPPPEVEPETTEMNIDELTMREDDEGSQDGWLIMDPAMRMRDWMLKEKNCLQCWKE